MAHATVWFVVDYDVDVTKFDEFDRLAKLMSEKSAEEPGTLLYKWHISADRTQCRLIESYVDGQAVIAHVTGPVIRDYVPQISAVSKVTLFEVYGDPGQEAAEVLASIGAILYKPIQGFGR
jgi:quinol monooxygenase YgiN